MVTPRTKPVLRYAGAKWRIAPWIVGMMPAHDTYVEPFCGSCAVLFAKQPVGHELVNDVDEDIVNLFRVIRDVPEELSVQVALTPYARDELELSYDRAECDDVERARRFLVRVWMAHGGKLGSRAGWRMWREAEVSDMPKQWALLPDRLWAVVERLRQVHVEHRDFRGILPLYDRPGALIYADPPYVDASLNTKDLYAHRMSDQDHLDLLNLLDAHRGPVLVSGYWSDLYDERLAGWTRVGTMSSAYRSSSRVEFVWQNPHAVDGNRQQVMDLSVIGVQGKQ